MHFPTLFIRGLSAAVLLASSSFAEKIEAALANEGTIKARLEAGAVALSERQATIRSLFADAGCRAEDQPIDKKSGNVICTLPGQTSASIVIGGHFDYVSQGAGLVDDWSGTSLLPSLYQALKARPRQHTYVFVAFAGEERGLLGSVRYVKNMSTEQKADVRAFVNLECLGLTPAKVWARRSNLSLIEFLNDVARAFNIPLEGVNVEKVGDDDTHPFANAKIPVISIHSVTQETFPILHTKRDSLDAIHFDDYYAAYKLAAYYLAYLDAKLD